MVRRRVETTRTVALQKRKPCAGITEAAREHYAVTNSCT